MVKVKCSYTLLLLPKKKITVKRDLCTLLSMLFNFPYLSGRFCLTYSGNCEAARTLGHIDLLI